MIANKLDWVSGKKAPDAVLEELNKKMAAFYGEMDQRQAYQVMIDEAHTSAGDPVNSLTVKMVEYIVQENFSNILEIGCGSGKIFKQLRQRGYKARYTGIEMAAPVIEDNKVNLPDATWMVGSVYDYSVNQPCFDCCIAFFVLEHLIYPEQALQNMLATLLPGGKLVLVFPDFSHSGIFPSQKVGFTYGKGAKEKLLKLKFADAVVSYLEGRMLTNKLKNVNQQYGQFVLNLNPYCLSKNCTLLTPDVDAVYISNRQEIEQWAKSLGHEVNYPFGLQDNMALNPFMSITKGK